MIFNYIFHYALFFLQAGKTLEIGSNGSVDPEVNMNTVKI